MQMVVHPSTCIFNPNPLASVWSSKTFKTWLHTRFKGHHGHKDIQGGIPALEASLEAGAMGALLSLLGGGVIFERSSISPPSAPASSASA